MDKLTKEEWVGLLQDLIGEKHDEAMNKKLNMFAQVIQTHIGVAEQAAFMEAKSMMQQQLNHMRWDVA